jgi:hypothetical protein
MPTAAGPPSVNRSGPMPAGAVAPRAPAVTPTNSAVALTDPAVVRDGTSWLAQWRSRFGTHSPSHHRPPAPTSPAPTSPGSPCPAALDLASPDASGTRRRSPARSSPSLRPPPDVPALATALVPAPRLPTRRPASATAPFHLTSSLHAFVIHAPLFVRTTVAGPTNRPRRASRRLNLGGVIGTRPVRPRGER